MAANEQHMSGLGARPWLIVPLVAAIHLTFAICLLLNPASANVTPMHTTTALFGDAAWAIYMGCAFSALFPMFIKMRSDFIHLCLWPQQTLLILMALSAVASSIRGSYPDGVVRVFTFIYADQCWSVYLCIAHLVATIHNATYQNGKA